MLISRLFFAAKSARSANKKWTKIASVDILVALMSPATCVRKWILLPALLLAFPVLVRSQTNGLQGGDIPLSGALQGDQVFPSAAFASSGGFLVWQDNIT